MFAKAEPPRTQSDAMKREALAVADAYLRGFEDGKKAAENFLS